jgi:Icc-related predicted phosphoesterase
MVVPDSKFVAKNGPKFCCKLCDYNTSKKCDYKKHIETIKHKMREMVVNGSKKSPKVATPFTCECGNVYKYDSGYYRHKTKCFYILKEKKDNDNCSDKELIMLLIKENKETRDALVEMSNKIQQPNIINNNNSHNKTFNLNFFLNEQCKNALNISEFVSSIKLDIIDLENTGKLGYVEGITRIIVNNLKSLDIFERPIHCSDVKREILYIKDEDKWEKESEEKEKLTKVIKVIANENIKQITEWKKNNPECKDPESMKNSEYLKIVSNAMSGSTEDETNKNM